MLSDSTIDTKERDHIIRTNKLARKKAELLTSLRMVKLQASKLAEERDSLLIALDEVYTQIREEKRAYAEHVKNLANAEEVAL